MPPLGLILYRLRDLYRLWVVARTVFGICTASGIDYVPEAGFIAVFGVKSPVAGRFLYRYRFSYLARVEIKPKSGRCCCFTLFVLIL